MKEHDRNQQMTAKSKLPLLMNKVSLYKIAQVTGSDNFTTRSKHFMFVMTRTIFQ